MHQGHSVNDVRLLSGSTCKWAIVFRFSDSVAKQWHWLPSFINKKKVQNEEKPRNWIYQEAFSANFTRKLHKYSMKVTLAIHHLNLTWRRKKGNILNEFTCSWLFRCHCSVFTKILISLANPGEELQDPLARTEINSPGFIPHCKKKKKSSKQSDN